MIKVLAMMKRKEGRTLEEFARYWHEEHAPLGFKVLPANISITRYVQHYAIPLEGLGEPTFDGVAEFCFHDMDMFQQWSFWYMSERGQVLRDDEDTFIDKRSARVVIVEEKVFLPGEELNMDRIKLIAMVKRKRGLTLEAFKKYWAEKHAPLAMGILPQVPYVKRYVHNYAIPLEGVGEPAFDGIGELCFDDLKAFEKSTEWFLGEGGKILRDDEENFVDHSTRVAVLVKQRGIIESTT